MTVSFRLPLVLTLALTACSVTSASATPITYAVSGTASGTLGATAFTNDPITISLMGDTSFVGLNVGPATVTIDGIGTASFTDSIGAFDNPGLPSAQISDVTLNLLLFGTRGPAVFSTYDLRGPVGPVTGAAFFNAFAAFPTTAGLFDISSVLNNTSTFTATVGGAAVPEPATLGLLGGGLLMVWRQRSRLHPRRDRRRTTPSAARRADIVL